MTTWSITFMKKYKFKKFVIEVNKGLTGLFRDASGLWP